MSSSRGNAPPASDTRAAVGMFQAKAGLDATGGPDAAPRAKLVEAEWKRFTPVYPDAIQGGALCHLLLPPRIVEEGDQFADIARLQAGPRDAQLLGARIHGRTVAPQRGGERNHGEGIGAGAQFGTVARTLGARAVT